MTTDNPGLLVTLQAKPGRENDLADFLNGGLATVTREPGTVTWYAFRINENTFGIYDTFRSEAGRQAHLSGKVAAALMEGDPTIVPRTHHADEGYLHLDAIEMTDDEIELTCHKVRQILSKGPRDSRVGSGERPA